MASSKDLKKRITTVKNTQQTTKAMKMVSAAKLRRSQIAIFNNRPYARKIRHYIRVVSAMSDVPLASDLIRRFEPGDTRKRKLLLVLVTSDRGLCGGFNSSIVKSGERFLVANRDKYESVQFAFVGKKGKEGFGARGHKAHRYFEFGKGVTVARAREISDWLIGSYQSGEFDEVRVVYNEFKNAISQIVTAENFLPLVGHTVEEAMLEEAEEAEGKGAKDDTSSVEKYRGKVDRYMLRPNAAGIMNSLLAKHFGVQMYRILLESQASEHGARMSAMDSATRNAGEMISNLTLQYNKLRQASITSELLDIISGAESQKG